MSESRSDGIVGAVHPLFVNVVGIHDVNNSWVYTVRYASRLEQVPSPPTLYAAVLAAREAVTKTEQYGVPAWIGLGLLGKLMLLGPSNDGGYLASFGFPPGHPQALVEEDDGQSGFLTCGVSGNVADVIINSGSLLALDNVCYGEAVEGLLRSICIFIEVDE